MERRAQDIAEDPKPLRRDVERFKSLAPNGRAEIKQGASTTLAFITSHQLVEKTENNYA